MFDALTSDSESSRLIPAAERHLETLGRLEREFSGCPGVSFVRRYIDAFSVTGSPFVVNLDLNASESATDGIDKMAAASGNITERMLETVRATARHVSGYKMNEQSMLTFLLAGKPKTVQQIKEIYSDETGVEPVVWTDEKLRDIPSTTYQTARIIYALGYDAIHCMPQIGPDVAGALQLAAGEFGRGTVHVVNLTHPGYNVVKAEYFKDPEGTIGLMREAALGSDAEVAIGKRKHNVNVRATGTIEPANRPNELFDATKRYGDRIMIISIGIGPQGALPGCALYAGAHIEGIGRFIFEGGRGFEDPDTMTRKSGACKRACLRALGSRYGGAMPYPLGDVMAELEGYGPEISPEAKSGLDLIFAARKEMLRTS